LRNDVNEPSKVISKKTRVKKLFFVGALKVTDEEKSRIWIRIRKSTDP
jgi:hypothetical protein